MWRSWNSSASSYDSFVISVFDKVVDGILGLSFVSKHDGQSFVVFVCYLPPATVWGRDAETI